MTHELKCWPEFFERVLDGSKPFELRKSDRPFAIGDTLLFREFAPCPKCAGGGRMADNGGFMECDGCNEDHGTYTGRTCERRITYALTGIGLIPGYIALGLAEISSRPTTGRSDELRDGTVGPQSIQSEHDGEDNSK